MYNVRSSQVTFILTDTGGKVVLSILAVLLFSGALFFLWAFFDGDRNGWSQNEDDRHTKRDEQRVTLAIVGILLFGGAWASDAAGWGDGGGDSALTLDDVGGASNGKSNIDAPSSRKESVDRIDGGGMINSCDTYLDGEHYASASADYHASTVQSLGHNIHRVRLIDERGGRIGVCRIRVTNSTYEVLSGS